jgi:hypothetical protein
LIIYSTDYSNIHFLETAKTLEEMSERSELDEKKVCYLECFFYIPRGNYVVICGASNELIVAGAEIVRFSMDL